MSSVKRSSSVKEISNDVKNIPGKQYWLKQHRKECQENPIKKEEADSYNDIKTSAKR